MKKLIFKFSLLFLGATLILISYLSLPSAKNKSNINQSVLIDTQFQVGAIHDGHYSLYNIIKDSLHFNVWHHYSGISSGWDDNVQDNYSAPENNPGSIVTARKELNDSKGLRTYFDRPIVSYIISGQRTDYQCEDLPSGNLYWFNSYKNSLNNNVTVYDINDKSKFGSEDRVKQCKTNNSPPDLIAGFINSGIKANRNLSYAVAANQWCSDDAWDWYVMPRVRIDPDFASKSSNDTVTVCKVIITGWKGNVVKDVSLRVVNFKDDNRYYDGKYIEQYNFGKGNELLKISTAEIKSHFLPPPGGNAFDWNDLSCKVDIKVYWTGKCNMWIDRVRLENEPAHRYLTLKDKFLIDKVNDEIRLAGSNNNGIPNYFYFEENTLSHFPLIQALNKHITDVSQGYNSLIVWYNDYQVNAQIPGFGHLTPLQVRELLIDSCKLKTIILGWYGLEGWSKKSPVPHRISYHPSSLLTEDYNPGKGVLSYVTGRENYENWLQDRVEKNQNFTTIMDINNLMVDLSKTVENQSGLNVVFCPQAHSFLMDGGPLKEPTNEEIELQTNISLMHNAKGIMYYWFGSWGKFTEPMFSRGIMDDDNNDGKLTPRYNSVYNQNKFAKIQELALKMNKWGPYFMKFDPDQTRNCIYRNPADRQSFFLNSYLSAFTTSVLNPNANCTETLPYTQTEPPDKTYLHIAAFVNRIADRNLYFMVSNNRCTPGDDDCSGSRLVSVSIKANREEFSGSDNWKIIDLYSDSVVFTFDKRTANNIPLGKFKPAEGKLYKIIPA